MVEPMRCTCTLTAVATHERDAMWDRDPTCDIHYDRAQVTAVIAALRAEITRLRGEADTGWEHLTGHTPEFLARRLAFAWEQADTDAQEITRLRAEVTRLAPPAGLHIADNGHGQDIIWTAARASYLQPEAVAMVPGALSEWLHRALPGPPP